MSVKQKQEKCNSIGNRTFLKRKDSENVGAELNYLFNVTFISKDL